MGPSIPFLMYMYFSIFEDTDTQPLTCNTEKDKDGRLNFRTAGNNNIVRFKYIQL